MEKLDIHMQKNEIGLFSHTINKNQLKINERLNVSPMAIKLLEENVEKKLLFFF